MKILTQKYMTQNDICRHFYKAFKHQVWHFFITSKICPTDALPSYISWIVIENKYECMLRDHFTDARYG